MRLRFTAAFVSSLMLVGAAAPLRAQSLAELAKKEEERRKAIGQPSKVYTNKDLGAPSSPSTPPPSTAAPSSSAPATVAPSTAASAEKAPEGDKSAAPASNQPVKNQAYWSGRKKALLEKMDRDQTYADALQSRINALQTDFVNRDDPAQRSVIERDRQKAIAELDRLKLQIAGGKKAVADFEEEARRAGVPPGWLR
jgi:hypothetical protein